MNSIVIFVKYPTPGKVKTRLGAQVGKGLAANLYRLFIEQTFTLVKKAAVSHVFVAYEPAELLDEFSKIIPPAFHHFPQIGENLGQRLIHAFEQVFSQHTDKVIILGSDSPTLPIEFVGEAFKRLKSFDLVLGPAEDGGYYLIGLKQPNKRLFENIQWSSTSVLQATVMQARELNLTYSLLPVWYDVDEVETLKRAVQDDVSGKIKATLQQHSEIRFS